jgi:ribonuclease HII
VVAGVSVREDRVEALRELGVRDSQLLSPRRREALLPEILRTCRSVKVLRIRPDEIDRVVRGGRRYRKLNYLEAVYMARVIDGLRVDRAVVDACDTSTERFRTNVESHLTKDCSVLARHFADRDFPVVSAASIVAKVERDAAVSALRESYGDFGSGYPSDLKTRTFFAEWLEREGGFPAFVRKSWKTWDRLRQERLSQF